MIFFADHYHQERNHQGLDNRLIESDHHERLMSNTIECVKRLGGMLRFYQRAAA
jgi:putative transposase